MSDELLKDILQEMCDEEFKEYGAAAEHKFSFSHRRKMKKLFREYNKNASDAAAKTAPRPRRRVIAAVIAGVFVLSCVSVGAWVTGGFKEFKKSDHSEIFAIDNGNSPETIEYCYYLAEVPEGFELTETDSFVDIDVTYTYTHNDGRHFDFSQTVKSEYKIYLSTDSSDLVDVFVNGKSGYFLDFLEGSTYLVWDNGDYVLELQGNLTKEEMFELAKSAKIKDF